MPDPFKPFVKEVNTKKDIDKAVTLLSVKLLIRHLTKTY